MTHYRSKDMYLAFGGTVLDTDFRTLTDDQSASLIDGSAGSDTHIPYIVGLIDGGVQITLVHQAYNAANSGTIQYAALEPGNTGTLEWGQEGTASGRPKNTVLAVVESRSVPFNYNDLTLITASFKFNSATGVTKTTY